MNKTLKSFAVGTQSSKTVALGLAAIIGLASVLPAALAAPPVARQQPTRAQQYRPSQYPARQQVRRPNVAPLDSDDILLVMPNAKAEKDEIKEVFEEAHGQVVAELGEGEMKILIVKTEHGKAAEVQRKLEADSKHFSAVDLNVKEQADWIQPIYKEPKLADSWHLHRMHCLDTFTELMTSARLKETIAVLDSGLTYGGETVAGGRGTDVTGIYKDIAGLLALRLMLGKSVESQEQNIIRWGNLAETMTLCMTDNNGHGSLVASSAAGGDNGKCSLGINPRTSVYPIRIADGPADATISTDELKEVAAMMVILQSGIRIVNISYANVMDPKKKVLHALIKFYHDKKGGLVFCSAGNKGQVLSFPPQPYLIVVSAMERYDSGLHLASKSKNKVFSSNYGNCVTFTAPGSEINCADRNNDPAIAYGTSFSSPIAAGIASLIWSTNRNLKNTDVETIMKACCENTTAGRNAKFGYGMPDAAKCVKMAELYRY